MLDKLVATLPPPKDMEEVDETDKPLAVAIVGRPNVGEWSLQKGDSVGVSRALSGRGCHLAWALHWVLLRYT